MIVELVIIVGLCVTHLAAPTLLRWVDRVMPEPAPVAHGLAVAFVFLHLMPEIGAGLADRGLGLAWLLLAGFLSFNALEARSEATRSAGTQLTLQLALAAAVSWLIGASLPAEAGHPIHAVVVFLACSMHLLEGHHRGMDGGALPLRWRALLASAVVAGVVADTLWAESIEALDEGLVAVVAGGILTTVFRSHFELGATERRFRTLVYAALGYGLIITLVAMG
jgi:hypothetical protein